MNFYPPESNRSQLRLSGRVLAIVAAALALFLLLGSVEFTTELFWFESLAVSGVFLTGIYGRLALFTAAGLFFLILFLGNVFVARRLAYTVGDRPRRDPGARTWEELLSQIGSEMAQRVDYARLINPLLLVAGAVIAIFMGLNAAGHWLSVLLFIHQQPFDVADPAFGLDAGFYVFAMPVLRAVEGWLFLALFLVALSVIAVYAVVLTYELAINIGQLGTALPTAIKRHLLCLVAVAFLLIAFHHVLEMLDLVRSSRGVAIGAGYTDFHFQRPAQIAMALAAILAATLCLANLAAARLRLAFVGAAVWVAAVGGGWAIPTLVQNLDVVPNELDRERPWIDASIQFTRRAFGLDRIEERDIAFEESVPSSVLVTDRDTLNNVRLWDHRPLRDTYRQIQAIRQYYTFEDVDVDRYAVDGEYRQVMISARELVPEQLPAQAQTWVSRRLQYTHGYGVAISLVNAVSQEGLPELIVRDVPPVGRPVITRPEIYYGEKTDHYVITRTATEEFNYPSGDLGVFSRSAADAGIDLGSLPRRALFALRFQDPNFLLNTGFQSESRLLYRRNVAERARTVVPFLRLDQDPYIVVADGALFWIHDAYTVSDRYPYSEAYSTDPAQRGVRRRMFNYIRNSVKIVTNAYDGSMAFYVVDPSDPLIQGYQGVFPGLFVPMDRAPRQIREHFRYPEGLFRIQAEAYKQYHVRDPRVFYVQEDVWTIPKEIFYAQQQPVDPYYVIMKLPGEAKPEFILMLPFTPGNKDNMVGWLAARSDDPDYGKMIVYKYPKDKIIFGPFQLETRIDQDPVISQQFTLWNQAGSQIIRGNLLVIPLGDSNLYVEPIYLQATASPLPELKRVIVATGNRIVMEPTLEEGLARLLPLGPGLAAAPGRPAPAVAPGAPTVVQTARELAAEASDQFRRAQEALRAGDFAAYGERLRAVEQALSRLVEVTGAP